MVKCNILIFLLIYIYKFLFEFIIHSVCVYKLFIFAIFFIFCNFFLVVAFLIVLLFSSITCSLSFRHTSVSRVVANAAWGFYSNSRLCLWACKLLFTAGAVCVFVCVCVCVCVWVCVCVSVCVCVCVCVWTTDLSPCAASVSHWDTLFLLRVIIIALINYTRTAHAEFQDLGSPELLDTDLLDTVPGSAERVLDRTADGLVRTQKINSCKSVKNKATWCSKTFEFCQQ